jgi:hypothetical protein
MQFHVFDLGNGRVLKVPRTFRSQIRRLITRKWPTTRADFAELVAEARRQPVRIDKSLRDLRSILDRIDPHLVGNPELYADGCYTQDKATPLANIVLRADPAKQCGLIDLYIDGIHATWRHGFAEDSFNFLANVGLGAGRRTVVLDLAGIYVQKRRVLRTIERRDWVLTWSYMRLVQSNLETARYFLSAMRKAMRPETLDALWATAPSLRRDAARGGSSG